MAFCLSTAAPTSRVLPGTAKAPRLAPAVRAPFLIAAPRHGMRMACNAFKVTFKLPEGEEETIEVPEDQYILDAADDAGLDLPYSCRSGESSCSVGRTWDRAPGGGGPAPRRRGACHPTHAGSTHRAANPSQGPGQPTHPLTLPPAQAPAPRAWARLCPAKWTRATRASWTTLRCVTLAGRGACTAPNPAEAQARPRAGRRAAACRGTDPNTPHVHHPCLCSMHRWRRATPCCAWPTRPPTA